MLFHAIPDKVNMMGTNALIRKAEFIGRRTSGTSTRFRLIIRNVKVNARTTVIHFGLSRIIISKRPKQNLATCRRCTDIINGIYAGTILR